MGKDEDYKFKLRDFMPTIGAINYIRRNYAADEFPEIGMRLPILELYNLSLIVTSVVGLEKILS